MACLKVHCMWFLLFQLCCQKNRCGLGINQLKYFWFWFRICRDIELFAHSMYYQDMCRFIPCIISNETDSFRIFAIIHKISFRVCSKYAQRKSIWKFISFCVFSVDVQIHLASYQYIYEQTDSVSSQHKYKFILLIQQITPQKIEYSELNCFVHSF
jgi:hypothetical protein